jgi:hypothetical protein
LVQLQKFTRGYARKNRNFMERTKRSYVWPHKTRLKKEVIMRPEHEYRHLADSTRRRGYVEQSALRAQWEILAWEISAATYRADAAADALRASSKRTSVGATSVTQTSLRAFV